MNERLVYRLREPKAEVLIRVLVEGMNAEDLRQALALKATRNPMGRIEEALWLELNEMKGGRRQHEVEVGIVHWKVESV